MPLLYHNLLVASLHIEETKQSPWLSGPCLPLQFHLSTLPLAHSSLTGLCFLNMPRRSCLRIFELSPLCQESSSRDICMACSLPSLRFLLKCPLRRQALPNHPLAPSIKPSSLTYFISL